LPSAERDHLGVVRIDAGNVVRCHAPPALEKQERLRERMPGLGAPRVVGEALVLRQRARRVRRAGHRRERLPGLADAEQRELGLLRGRGGEVHPPVEERACDRRRRDPRIRNRPGRGELALERQQRVEQRRRCLVGAEPRTGAALARARSGCDGGCCSGACLRAAATRRVVAPTGEAAARLGSGSCSGHAGSLKDGATFDLRRVKPAEH
jgi:hypothetical protein